MIIRFLTWVNQTLCGWTRHNYQHITDGYYECTHCGKEMPDDEF